MNISGYGISLSLPTAWEGRIYQRSHGYPIAHAGSFALPADDADFGSGAIIAMGPTDAFAALLEYDPVLAGTGIFAPLGLPLPLRAAEANPKTLQRIVRGRTAVQRFFTQSGRAFCLYVVFPSNAWLQRKVAEANRILATVTIEPRGGPR
jgi:hypothetical protein